MKTNKKYKICEYNRVPSRFSYINNDTTDLKNGWITHANMPNNKESLKEKNVPSVKHFTSKLEAEEYLDVVNNYWLEYWNENQHYYKVNGYKKPQWKIYEVV